MSRTFVVLFILVLLVGGTVSAAEIQLSSVLYPAKTSVDVPISGTPRAPAAELEAKVKNEAGQSTIVIEYKKMPPAVLFGGDIVSYVVWAVGPDGKAQNLGGIANVEDKGNETYLTPMRDFALIVTAEPMVTVQTPGEVVVFTSGTPASKKVQVKAFSFNGLSAREGHITVEHDSIAGMNYKKGDKSLALIQAEKAVELMDRFEAKNYDPKAYDGAMTAIAEARDKGGQKQLDASQRTVVLASQALVKTFGQRQAEAEATQMAKTQAEREALSSRASDLEGDLSGTIAQLRETEAELASVRRQAAQDAEQMEAAKVQLSRQNKGLENQISGVLGQMGSGNKTDRGYVVSLAGGAFPSGTASLTTDAKYVLSKLSGMLLIFPEVSLAIEGHTDSTGSDEINLTLSQERADAVKTFLREMGFPDSRMAATGKGSSEPVAPNDTPEGRSKNRRVDIVMSGVPE